MHTSKQAMRNFCCLFVPEVYVVCGLWFCGFDLTSDTLATKTNGLVWYLLFEEAEPC